MILKYNMKFIYSLSKIYNIKFWDFSLIFTYDSYQYLSLDLKLNDLVWISDSSQRPFSKLLIASKMYAQHHRKTYKSTLWP